MLKTIHADEVDLDGKALAVRYREDPEKSDLVMVNITVHITHSDRDYIISTEMYLVAVREQMMRQAMYARVQAEAERRKIERVAWIEES